MMQLLQEDVLFAFFKNYSIEIVFLSVNEAFQRKHIHRQVTSDCLPHVTPIYNSLDNLHKKLKKDRLCAWVRVKLCY